MKWQPFRKFSERFVHDWSELIGPEYAKALLPVRLTILVGGTFFMACFITWMIWGVLFLAHVTLAVYAVVTVAFNAPGFAVMSVGLIRMLMLSRRIRLEMIYAGFPDPISGPDLRGKLGVTEWAKRRNVPLETVALAAKAPINQ